MLSQFPSPPIYTNTSALLFSRQYSHQLSIKSPLLNFLSVCKFSRFLMYMKTERFMEKQTCIPNTTLSPLAMHKNSHTISKSKPKIRIIHIFAPEIIKTDAANFRELVQRLTGKPTDDHRNNCCAKKTSRVLRKKEQRILSSNKKMEVSWRGGCDALIGERIKGEDEIWRGANSGGGFLAGFAEFDGFMQELNQFPFLEGTTQMDAYGESQLA